MSEQSHPHFRGGCQCGAVRFHIKGVISGANVCHCRMCQKASGAPFLIHAIVAHADLEWTRGAPANFQTSQSAKRGFCPACGTTLTYDWGGQSIGITVGAFDRPNEIMPTIEYLPNRRHPVLADLDALEGKVFGDPDADPSADLGYQHPDHDTLVWPLPHTEDEKP